MSRTLSVCVFCGSRDGTRAAYRQAAASLGRQLGERGWRLVYGGGNVGLMGVLADAALAAGAQVTGVIPDSLLRREVGHRGLHELHVVPTMHVRKQLMAERADAFVALPGGLGTLEELFEVWTWRQLGYHQHPLGLLNVSGYFDPLLAFVERAVQEGFVSDDQRCLLHVADSPERLLDLVAGAAPGPQEGGADFARV